MFNQRQQRSRVHQLAAVELLIFKSFHCLNERFVYSYVCCMSASWTIEAQIKINRQQYSSFVAAVALTFPSDRSSCLQSVISRCLTRP